MDIELLTGHMGAGLTLECFFRIFGAALCGLFIGIERRTRLKEAGMRTHLIVAVGAALITIVSKYGFFDLLAYPDFIKADPTRVAAQIVSGVGFLGAGIIFMRHQTLTGLTTAAGIWTTAGIGMAMGCGIYPVAVFSTLLILTMQLILHHQYRWASAPGFAVLTLRSGGDAQVMGSILQELALLRVEVLNVEMSHKKSGDTRYEFFLKLPRALRPEQVGEQMAAISDVTYVDI